MKFYNREEELALLRKIENQSKENAKMTFVLGRRRIGKTRLLKKALENELFIYFFVARKSETLLCEEYIIEIKRALNKEVFGTFNNFKEVFGYLLELSKTTHFTLVIDEFQEFFRVNPSIYSEMQHLWDDYKDESKMNLILCGSIYSLMNKIFENAKEPLFGRASNRLHIVPFSIETIKQIYEDNAKNYSNDDILFFYAITGGVAKYVELLAEEGVYRFDEILNYICSDNSLFIDEGKNLLIDEFGKDYGNYFSILSLIAASKTSRTEIESILGMQTGGFLEKLEYDFGLIQKVKPVFSKPNSRSVKYYIKDNFLNFWFRFIYKYRTAIEIGNMNFIKETIRRDYTLYSGKILEKYFIEKLSAENKFSMIGTYWEKSTQNEIDIVAVNDQEKKILCVEVKRNPAKIDIKKLKNKATKLIQTNTDYSFEFKGLSMNDM